MCADDAGSSRDRLLTQHHCCGSPRRALSQKVRGERARSRPTLYPSFIRKPVARRGQDLVSVPASCWPLEWGKYSPPAPSYPLAKGRADDSISQYVQWFASWMREERITQVRRNGSKGSQPSTRDAKTERRTGKVTRNNDNS